MEESLCCGRFSSSARCFTTIKLTFRRWIIIKKQQLSVLTPPRPAFSRRCWRMEIDARLRGPRLYESRKHAGLRPPSQSQRPWGFTSDADGQSARELATETTRPFRMEHAPRDAIGTCVSESWRRTVRLPLRREMFDLGANLKTKREINHRD